MLTHLKNIILRSYLNWEVVQSKTKYVDAALLKELLGLQHNREQALDFTLSLPGLSGTQMQMAALPRMAAAYQCLCLSSHLKREMQHLEFSPWPTAWL